MTTTLSKLDPAAAFAPYEPSDKQPFDIAAAAHLYRRAGFAANYGELQQAVKDGPAKTLDRLFGSTNATPANDGDKRADNATGDDQFESQMQMMGRSMMATGNSQQLSVWWLYRMLHSPDQLPEKTALFWHGHFATSAAKVDSAQLMFQHHALLHKHALGKFEPFVQDMSRDPAMLIWLDAASNRKVRPNENYARELMELFCLGVGHYTEDDIKEVARCFTGWEVTRRQFRFNKYQHDEGVKKFLGASGNFNGDDAVRIVLEQKAAPRFIATKLCRYFIAEEPALPDELVEVVAKKLRATDFDIAATVRMILGSRLFFSDHARGRIVRSPVSLGVGLLRALEGTTNMITLAQGLQELGQAVFYPPNVKGWDGGRTWIDSSTLLGRANLVRRVLADESTRFAGGSLSDLADQHDIAGGEQTVDWLLSLLVAVPVPSAVRKQLVHVLDEPGDRKQRLSRVVYAIATQPEFQLV